MADERRNGVLANLMQRERERVDLTQEQLAERSLVSVRQIRNIERGVVRRPRRDTVVRLAEGLGLSGEAAERFVAAGRDHDRHTGAEVPADGDGDAPTGGIATEPEDPDDAAAARPGVPAQLPLAVRGFTGRHDELDQLDEVAFADLEQAAAVIVHAVSGAAGVGKTALVVHWAHRVRHRFPDGQLYLNLRGFDPSGRAVAPGEAVGDFLAALNVPAQRIPASLDARAALFRSTVAGRRILVVLDNARDAEQVRPLLPGVAGCLAVVTSRSQLVGLAAAEGAHLLTIGLLPAADARQLLARRIGAARVAAEPAATDRLVARCGRLPLALAIVAARAASRPGQSLAALAAELMAAGDGLDLLASGDPSADIRAVFSWSYAALSAPAARVFRLLGLHPGPDLTVPAAASLAGLPTAPTRRALDELARLNMITDHGPGRYAFHDLLRAYARELVRDAEPEPERQEAIGRMLDHYLHAAYTAARILHPHREPISPPPARPAVTLVRLADRAEAMAWFTAERRVLLGAIERGAEYGLDQHVWQLAWAAADFLDRQGHWADWAAVQESALAATTRLDDLAGQAYAHRGIAGAHARMGRHDKAMEHYGRALELAVKLADARAQAHAHLLLAWVHELQERFVEALDHSRSAMELYRAEEDDYGHALALNQIGWYEVQIGRHGQALRHCQQALQLQQRLGDQFGEAATWDSLGVIHQYLGEHDSAADAFERAIRLRRDLGDRHGEASTLVRLGDHHRAAGDTVAARGAWQRALAILDALGHADADDVRRKLNQTGN